MIKEAAGNLLQADADALVNTVNTVGVMGKGIALQFKQAYPDNFRAYEAACSRGEVQIGRMFVFETDLLANPRFIINFPTKTHWRAHSRLADIASGLEDLRKVITDRPIASIAVPPLGCGNGGLSWRDVRPLIIGALGDLPGVEITIYPPAGAPPAQSMAVRTVRPRMTMGRAAVLALLGRYVKISQDEQVTASTGASLLEIQKLMYFLQEAGQPLRLNFAKARYGPYAENLNHALQALEGHYIRGYGDRSQLVTKLSPVKLIPNAEDEANRWLQDDSDQSLSRIDRVVNLVTGFASAYGLELLATVHWALAREASVKRPDPAALTELVASWNHRKGRLFTEVHVGRAMDRLVEYGWVRS